MELKNGQLLSEKLSEMIKDKTSANDRFIYSVNGEDRPSVSAIEKVLLRVRPITDFTKPAILHLCQLTFERNLKERTKCSKRMSFLSRSFGFRAKDVA